jgi:hypothetical protein
MTGASTPPTPTFLFDLDGTLVDRVYQHVLACATLSNNPACPFPSGASTATSA